MSADESTTTSIADPGCVRDPRRSSHLNARLGCKREHLDKRDSCPFGRLTDRYILVPELLEGILLSAIGKPIVDQPAQGGNHEVETSTPGEVGEVLNEQRALGQQRKLSE